ncbi:hypothetical protein COL11_09915 [Bacillus anthracis]|nr:hypothetical protein COL11_09915 [Bacillus anthracis]
MKGYKDVYMLVSETIDGNYSQAGKVYAFNEDRAKELVKEGKGQEPYDYMLNYWCEKSEQLLEDFQKERDAIRESDRLTETAKAEDIQALIEKYDREFDTIQRLYEGEIKSRLEEAKKEAGISALKEKAQFDSDQVRREAGIIATDVIMTTSLTEAITYLEGKLEFIDKEVARELLSQFTTIKTHLDSLNSKSTVGRGIASTRIRSVYEDLKRASSGEAQVEVDSKVGLYTALNDDRNDITWEWRRKKLFMEVR